MHFLLYFQLSPPRGLSMSNYLSHGKEVIRWVFHPTFHKFVQNLYSSKPLRIYSFMAAIGDPIRETDEAWWLHGHWWDLWATSLPASGQSTPFSISSVDVPFKPSWAVFCWAPAWGLLVSVCMRGCFAGGGGGGGDEPRWAAKLGISAAEGQSGLLHVV